MTVALVLVGMWALAAFEFDQVVTSLRQQVGEIEILLDENVDDPTARSLFARARLVPGVADATFISREEARRVFLETFGEEGGLFQDDAFLPPSIRVRVSEEYANPDSLGKLSDQFSRWNRVDEALLNRPLLARVEGNVATFTAVGWMLGVVVALASLFLVANTIRLTIYARRLLIRTMKLVGATDAFIRRPFIVEGVAQGLLAGAGAALLLWPSFFAVAAYVPQIQLPGALRLAALTTALLLTGATLGWAGSALAVHRFIRRVPLH